MGEITAIEAVHRLSNTEIIDDPFLDWLTQKLIGVPERKWLASHHRAANWAAIQYRRRFNEDITIAEKYLEWNSSRTISISEDAWFTLKFPPEPYLVEQIKTVPNARWWSSIRTYTIQSKRWIVSGQPETVFPLFDFVLERDFSFDDKVFDMAAWVAAQPLQVAAIRSYYNQPFQSAIALAWAHFFYRLRLGWLHRPGIFNLQGKAFSPDFWLPHLNAWLIVSPFETIESYKPMGEMLSRQSQFNVILQPDEPYDPKFPEPENAAYLYDKHRWHSNYYWSECPICGRIDIAYKGKVPEFVASDACLMVGKIGQFGKTLK